LGSALSVPLQNGLRFFPDELPDVGFSAPCGDTFYAGLDPV